MKQTLLLIEDDDGVQITLDYCLKRFAPERYSIIWCQNLSDGMDNASKAVVILLDLGLPDSNTDATVLQIPLLDKFGPVIALTGQPDPSLVERCIAAGAEDFLPKTVALNGTENDARWLINTLTNAAFRWARRRGALTT